MKSYAPENTPEKLEWIGDKKAVSITWKDGHQSRYDIAYLRQICPCANCRGTHEQPPLAEKKTNKFQVFSDAEASVARQQVRVAQAYPVGNYAIGLLWADGHSDGIYSFSYLRTMCPTNADEDGTIEF